MRLSTCWICRSVGTWGSGAPGVATGARTGAEPSGWGPPPGSVAVTRQAHVSLALTRGASTVSSMLDGHLLAIWQQRWMGGRHQEAREGG